MQKTSINRLSNPRKNSAIELVQWPSHAATIDKALAKNVLAIQTTREAPSDSPRGAHNDQTSPYQHFNLGLHVGDCSKQVEKNRQLLQALLPEKTKIQWLEQVHGNDVIDVIQVSKKAIVADAAVTTEKNICLAIMTADCLPILLASKNGDEIAAIHGGWRSLAANIVINTLNKMQTPAADIYAWLGPCISQRAFEVGSEVKATFVQQNPSFNSAFILKPDGKYLANLHTIAALQLEGVGINKFSSLPECTYFNNDKYYSYRKNAIAGRMASLICRV